MTAKNVAWGIMFMTPIAVANLVQIRPRVSSGQMGEI